MLVQEYPSLPDIHPRCWVKVRGYELLEFQASFEAFMLQRRELMLVLRELSEREWAGQRESESARTANSARCGAWRFTRQSTASRSICSWHAKASCTVNDVRSTLHHCAIASLVL